MLMAGHDRDSSEEGGSTIDTQHDIRERKVSCRRSLCVVIELVLHDVVEAFARLLKGYSLLY